MNQKNHRSNSLAEASTIFGITLLLTLFGIFIYFIWSANQKSNEIKEQLSVDIIFHENVDESVVLIMEKQLNLYEYVKKASYISKKAAQDLMMKHVGNDAFDILDGVNPLPASIHVNLSSNYVNPDSALAFSNRIMKGNEHLISEIAYNEAQFLEVGAVFKNFETILLIVAIILLAIAILLIYNTIRLAWINIKNIIMNLKSNSKIYSKIIYIFKVSR